MDMRNASINSRTVCSVQAIPKWQSRRVIDARKGKVRARTHATERTYTTRYTETEKGEVHRALGRRAPALAFQELFCCFGGGVSPVASLERWRV